MGSLRIFWKEINGFIPQECIKFIQSDSKDVFYVIKCTYCAHTCFYIVLIFKKYLHVITSIIKPTKTTIPVPNHTRMPNKSVLLQRTLYFVQCTYFLM